MLIQFSFIINVLYMHGIVGISVGLLLDFVGRWPF